MQFQSKQKREMARNSIIRLLPDVLISIIFAIIFKPSFLGFVYCMAWLQALYLAIWIKNSICDWSIFYISRRQLAENLADFLKLNKFPVPLNYETSPHHYFERVADSTEYSIELRIKAAVEYTHIFNLEINHKIQEGMRVDMAYEDAIAAYKRHIELSGA